MITYSRELQCWFLDGNNVTSSLNFSHHCLDSLYCFCFLLSYTLSHFDYLWHFLRATAVPPGTAEARISYGNSVCLSVCHDPVVYQAQVR